MFLQTESVKVSSLFLGLLFSKKQYGNFCKGVYQRRAVLKASNCLYMHQREDASSLPLAGKQDNRPQF